MRRRRQDDTQVSHSNEKRILGKCKGCWRNAPCNAGNAGTPLGHYPPVLNRLRTGPAPYAHTSYERGSRAPDHNPRPQPFAQSLIWKTRKDHNGTTYDFPCVLSSEHHQKGRVCGITRAAHQWTGGILLKGEVGRVCVLLGIVKIPYKPNGKSTFLEGTSLRKWTGSLRKWPGFLRKWPGFLKK